jgi:hypothetical protein
MLLLHDNGELHWTAVNENFPVGLAVRQPGKQTMKRSRFSEQQIAFNSAPGRGVWRSRRQGEVGAQVTFSTTECRLIR